MTLHYQLWQFTSSFTSICVQQQSHRGNYLLTFVGQLLQYWCVNDKIVYWLYVGVIKVGTKVKYQSIS